MQLDSDWARRLHAALRVGRTLTLLLAALLACALVAVTFNTIRLQILTRREEIEVSSLIGATKPFIRRPFLYFGAIQGLAGGLTAWLVVAAAVWILNRDLGWAGRPVRLRLAASGAVARRRCGAPGLLGGPRLAGGVAISKPSLT